MSRRIRCLSWVLGMLMAAAFLVKPVEAQKPFLRTISRDYQLQPQKIGKCVLCHQLKEKEKPTRENLNPFGKVLQGRAEMKDLLEKDEKYVFKDAELAKLSEAVKAVAGEDADGDGAANGEELALGTFPGDSASKPEEKALAEYRKKNPPSAQKAEKTEDKKGEKK